MAGLSPDSSSVKPWTWAGVFIFSEGVPENESQVQMLASACAQRPPPPSQEVAALVSLLGLRGNKLHRVGGGSALQPELLGSFL